MPRDVPLTWLINDNHNHKSCDCDDSNNNNNNNYNNNNNNNNNIITIMIIIIIITTIINGDNSLCMYFSVIIKKSLIQDEKLTVWRTSTKVSRKRMALLMGLSHLCPACVCDPGILNTVQFNKTRFGFGLLPIRENKRRIIETFDTAAAKSIAELYECHFDSIHFREIVTIDFGFNDNEIVPSVDLQFFRCKIIFQTRSFSFSNFPWTFVNGKKIKQS